MTGGVHDIRRPVRFSVSRNSAVAPETEKSRHISRLKRKAFASLRRTGVALPYPKGVCRRGADVASPASSPVSGLGPRARSLASSPASGLRPRARPPASGPELGLAKGRRASVALQILFYSVTLRNACVTLALHPIFYSVTPFPTFQDIKDREKYWKT